MGATYEGIDVAESYFGVPTVATRLMNLADLSYPDNSFDLVVSNQSMEHWGEFGCSLRWGFTKAFGLPNWAADCASMCPFTFTARAISCSADWAAFSDTAGTSPTRFAWNVGANRGRDSPKFPLSRLLAAIANTGLYSRYSDDENARNSPRKTTSV